jgi:hypothetical protein
MPNLLRQLLVLILAVAAGTLPAAAATVSIVSMQYSAGHPVPHIHYEGETVDGDLATLQGLYESFVKCRLSCVGPEGGATAVLTLNGPGGSYYEGLAIADYLRANHIATVVERGATCYSACAFAFLGGSGYSPQEGIGTYIDRMVEPGSIVGFHAPYSDEENFTNAMKERGAMAVQGDTRSSLAVMVKELVKWNVDPEVLFYMVNMGPDETYNLIAADDLYLARTALPPSPTSAWVTDVHEAIRNVCIRLLANYERADPLDIKETFPTEWVDQIGKTQFGTISGFKLGDRLLDIGNCSVTDESLATNGDYEVALYMTPGLDGTNAPMSSFFNRQNGWSSMGIGGNPVKRILQKGPLNHYFLPVGVPIDDLDLPGEKAIEENRFYMMLPPLMANLPDGFEVQPGTLDARVAAKGNVVVFERVGPTSLFDSAASLSGLGRTFSNNAGNETSFVREGSYDDTGTPFVWFGLKSGDTATVIEAMVVRADGEPADSDDMATLHDLMCGTNFSGARLNCE